MEGFNHPLELALLGGLRETAHVARDGHGSAPIRHGQLLLDVLGNIHQDGTGAACPC